MGNGGSSDHFAKLRRVDHLLTLEEYVGKSLRPLSDEFHEIWSQQSSIVEEQSSHHKLDKAFDDDENWVWSDIEREHIWRYFTLHSRYKSMVMSEQSFENWLKDIKKDGKFVPKFAYHSSDDFINHCKVVSEEAILAPSVKEAGIGQEEAMALAAVVDSIGTIALDHNLRSSFSKFSFGTTLTTAYTGLVKLARHTKPAERTYIWEGLYSDSLFGKSACEVLKKDEHGFLGAISRTFVHTTTDLDHVLKCKNEWEEHTILFEIEERQEDEGGLHNGVLIPPLFVEPDNGGAGADPASLLHKDLRLYPPLTLFQIKNTRIVSYPIESLSPRAKLYFRNRKTVDILFVVLDPLFSPTPHLPQLLPPPSVWEAVRTGNVEEVRTWVRSHPSVNLETVHPEYQCSLLYSASRSGHLDVVRELLRGCACVNAQSPKHGSTPLHVACYYVYVEIVEQLLLSGADPEIKNKNGLTPIQEVPAHRNRNMILNHLNSWKRPLPLEKPGKMVGSYLIYGDRLHYLKGFKILGTPVLTLAEEFSRDLILYEKSSGYHKTRAIWDSAVSSLAHLKTLAPANNLTDEEILALRIYTGPFYVVINQFLRKLFTAEKKDQQKQQLTRENSWVSTVLHLNMAIHKLTEVDVGGISTSKTMSYRGLDKMLRPDFFVPDRRGMIAATEFGFMSTSTSKECALEFTGEREATLFCVKPRCPDASGFHAGAELSWCSEYPRESEILFPPLTLFEVIKRKRKNNLTKITVAPTFV